MAEDIKDEKAKKAPGNAKQKAKAKEVFARYKDVNEAFILEDGNAFFDEGAAKYGEQLTKQKYTKFTR